ncbi:hypothetical protein N7463_006190 [Penicillium fimorum]|uniref:Tail specific protease domain-containing protein n=1 Tax=Penicillium fimorum TaxID=1882269 RepID=A0A9X0C6E8_9EURO|nr:hypothetical protein N7463_006190 [Penicillium fimorum]
MGSFENIVDGDTLFQVACMPGHDNSSIIRPTTHPVFSPYELPSSGPTSYPRPVVHDSKHLIQGYYLNENEYRDVAVLQIPTFKLDGEIPKTFSQTARRFVNQSIADGKTKMIIDLSGNGGGDINIGLNIFRIFFPHENIDTRTRFRATELIYLMGKVFSSDQAHGFYADFPLDLPLVAHLAVTPNQNETFGSWEELYGPKDIQGVPMSQLYSTFNFTSASTEDDPIAGYGNVTPTHASQPFKAENIIIMTDGYCASTCVILAKLLQEQGVQSIAFGGRPRHAPMQLLGGVKGGQYWSLTTISRYVREAYTIAVNASEMEIPILTAEEMRRYREISPPPTQSFSLRFDIHGSSGVNFRNAYSERDGETPLQFIYESASCRLFFTAENYVRPATLWLAAAAAMFGNGSCVPGSTIMDLKKRPEI